MGSALLLIIILCLTGCELFNDLATRLEYAIEAGVSHLGSGDGDRYTIRDKPPNSLSANSESYSVQLDKVVTLIVWYKDASCRVTESGKSTSYHSRSRDNPLFTIALMPACQNRIGSVCLRFSFWSYTGGLLYEILGCPKMTQGMT